MLKKLIIILLPIFAFGQTNINYKIHYADKPESEGLKVQVSFKSKKAADSTYFNFPNEVWGETNLTNCLEILKTDNPGYTFKIVADSNRIVVYHPKTNTVSFAYRIKQDHQDNDDKSLCRPKIKHNYFHVLGHSLFAVPEMILGDNGGNPKLLVNIEWVGFPDDFKIHNTFGTGLKKQTLKVKLWDELYNSLFVGGDYRIYSFSHLNKPVYFAIRGNWLNDYTDEKLFAALKKTISTQRDFWQDNNFNYYTVIITPSLTRADSSFKGQSMKGSAVKNGFLIQSTNNPFNNWNMMRYLFNHEMMHDWIGGKIAMRNEELNFWFSEGFTDYYTYKNRLRSGDLSFKEWTNSFNKDVLSAHWKNPEKNQPNYILRDDFWKSRNIEKIPYRRGAIFAFWIDNQIMKKSNYTKSLDHLMRELLTICVTGNKKFTDELFLEIAQKYVKQDIAYFFQKHIICGTDIEFKPEDLIDEFKIEYEEKIPQIVVDKELPNKYLLK